MKKGKFFVLEGMDGSGKATQTKLLVEFLKNKGFQVEKIDFPQYTKISAGLIENYLKGVYGSSKEVGPYRASIFYACDRYDLSFKIKQWLREGKIVIADRYIASNIGHQGGKLITDKDKLRKRTAYLGDSKKQDIHEADKIHLANTLKSYMAISKKFPKEYKIIECEEKNYFLPIDIIHNKIIKLVEQKI